MLKRHYFWMAITALLLCTGGSFALKYQNTLRDYNALVRSHSGLWENYRTMERYLVVKDSLEIASERLQVGTGEWFTHLGAHKPAYLKDIVGENRGTVVLRLVEDVCMSCYGSLLDDFRELTEGKNTAYITSYKNVRELGRLADSQNISASVFNSPEFKIPLDALKAPFLFVLDKSGKATNFFAVSKSHPQLLRDYLRSLIP